MQWRTTRSVTLTYRCGGSAGFSVSTAPASRFTRSFRQRAPDASRYSAVDGIVLAVQHGARNSYRRKDDQRQTRSNTYTLVEDFATAMLVTDLQTGYAFATMAIAELRALRCVLRHQHRFAEGRRDQCQPECEMDIPSSKQYASLSGNATIVRDQALVARLYRRTGRFGSRGKTDHRFRCSVQCTHGEYWDTQSAGIEVVFEQRRPT